MAESSPKKDVWDRITALAGILVPASIALAGHFIGDALKKAEVASQEKRADLDRNLAKERGDLDRQLAKEGVRVTQANLINTLMKSLTSDNAQERRLAVQAVLIALPEEGPSLARIVEKSDKDSTVKDAARASIDGRIESLMQDLFSSSGPTRITAAQQLIQGWRGDAQAANSILKYALAHPGNSNGIFNTAIVLKDFAATALVPNRSEVQAFAEVGRRNGAETAEHVRVLLSRIGAQPG